MVPVIAYGGNSPTILRVSQSSETGKRELAYDKVGCRPPRPCCGPDREEPGETLVQCDKLGSISLHAH